jgi:hypothetical protein
VINYRFKGLVEKICKTHAIVLAKLIKLRVRSEKGLDWIWMKESKLFREFSGKGTRHKKSILDKRKHQGVKCKTTVFLL